MAFLLLAALAVLFALACAEEQAAPPSTATTVSAEPTAASRAMVGPTPTQQPTATRGPAPTFLPAMTPRPATELKTVELDAEFRPVDVNGQEYAAIGSGKQIYL